MSERVLAGCTQSGNRPGVTVLDDGRVLVTGAWHCADGAEVTVAPPADVFDRAARSWLAERRWYRRLGFRWEAVGCALAGTAVGTVVQDLTGSAGWGDLAGLPVVVVGVLGLFWWRRRGGRRG